MGCPACSQRGGSPPASARQPKQPRCQRLPWGDRKETSVPWFSAAKLHRWHRCQLRCGELCSSCCTVHGVTGTPRAASSHRRELLHTEACGSPVTAVCCGDSTQSRGDIPPPGLVLSHHQGPEGVLGPLAGAISPGPGLSHARAELPARATLRRADGVGPQGVAAESRRAGTPWPACACNPSEPHPGLALVQRSCCRQLWHLSNFSQSSVMAEPAVSQLAVQLDFPSPRNTVN